MPSSAKRVVTYQAPGAGNTAWKAEVKWPGGREYVGTLPTREAAEAAGLLFIQTGAKPPRAKRGPKGPHAGTNRPRPPRTPRPKTPTPPPGTRNERHPTPPRATWREIYERTR